MNARMGTSRAAPDRLAAHRDSGPDAMCSASEH